MPDLFAQDWRGDPFQTFGASHWIALTIVLLIQLFLIFCWKNPSPRARRAFRYALAALLVVNESLWHWWNWQIGQWSIQYMLPLHICSLMVWLCAAMLVSENYALYPYIYFLGIGAASQPLFTPDAGIYGFPHFRFFNVFISHGAIITTAIYLTAIEKLRPTWKAMARVFIGGNVYLLFILLVNALIGSNYLFVARKPAMTTLIDYLPEWPWYILSLELISVVVFLILYAPFAIKDRCAQA